MSMTETATAMATVVTNSSFQIDVIEIPEELVSSCGNWIRFEYMDKVYANVGRRHVVETVVATPDGNILMELTVPTKQDAIHIGQKLYHIANSVHTFENGFEGKYEIELQPWSFEEHLARHCKLDLFA